MGKLRKTDFLPFINQVFTIRPNDGRMIPVKLASITTCHISDQYECFTLNFDPPDGETALPDGSYIMENDNFGPAVIFISPTPTGEPDPRKYYYEAVFNVFIGPEDKR
jgi:hypothetical protein